MKGRTQESPAGLPVGLIGGWTAIEQDSGSSVRRRVTRTSSRLWRRGGISALVLMVLAGALTFIGGGVNPGGSQETANAGIPFIDLCPKYGDRPYDIAQVSVEGLLTGVSAGAGTFNPVGGPSPEVFTSFTNKISGPGAGSLYAEYGTSGLVFSHFDTGCNPKPIIGNMVANYIFAVPKVLNTITFQIFSAASDSCNLDGLVRSIPQILSGANAANGGCDADGRQQGFDRTSASATNAGFIGPPTSAGSTGTGGGLVESIYTNFLPIALLFGALMLLWKGLGKKQTTEALQGMIWMVGSLAMAAVLWKFSAKFAGWGNQAVDTVGSSAYQNLSGGANDTTDNYSNAAAAALYDALLLTPWSRGQFGYSPIAKIPGVAQYPGLERGMVPSMNQVPYYGIPIPIQLAILDAQVLGKNQQNSDAAATRQYGPNGRDYFKQQTKDNNCDLFQTDNFADAECGANTLLPDFVGTNTFKISDYQWETAVWHLRGGGGDSVAVPKAFTSFQGDNVMGRIGIAFLAMLASFAIIPLLLYVSVMLIVRGIAMILLIILSPLFLVIGVVPGAGRTIALKWLESLLGTVAERIVLALFMAVIVGMYRAVMGGLSSSWLIEVLLAVGLSIAGIIYSKRLLSVFNIVNLGGGGGNVLGDQQSRGGRSKKVLAAALGGGAAFSASKGVDRAARAKAAAVGSGRGFMSGRNPLLAVMSGSATGRTAAGKAAGEQRAVEAEAARKQATAARMDRGSLSPAEAQQRLVERARWNGQDETAADALMSRFMEAMDRAARGEDYELFDIGDVLRRVDMESELRKSFGSIDVPEAKARLDAFNSLRSYGSATPRPGGGSGGSSGGPSGGPSGSGGSSGGGNGGPNGGPSGSGSGGSSGGGNGSGGNGGGTFYASNESDGGTPSESPQANIQKALNDMIEEQRRTRKAVERQAAAAWAGRNRKKQDR